MDHPSQYYKLQTATSLTYPTTLAPTRDIAKALSNSGYSAFGLKYIQQYIILPWPSLGDNFSSSSCMAQCNLWYDTRCYINVSLIYHMDNLIYRTWPFIIIMAHSHVTFSKCKQLNIRYILCCKHNIYSTLFLFMWYTSSHKYFY